MKVPAHFGFYGIITDPIIGYEKMAEILVEHGVRFIQLRMKHVARAEVRKVARRLRAIIPGGHFFIVNDDPHIAAESEADGVHLGQTDMDYREARQLLGDQAIIGLSTHNPKQTIEACEKEPDYIGIGPVYSTPTKDDPDPVIGLDGMQEMLRVATVPAVALGGIDDTNVGDVVRFGARNVSSVRFVNQSIDPSHELALIIRALSEKR